MRTSGSPALYDTLVALHVASAVVGFGAVAVSGAYGAVGRHGGRQVGPREGQAGRSDELRRFFATPLRAELLILVVPFLGAAALAVRPTGSDFAAAWVLIGVAIWVAASAVLLGLVRPAESRLRRALEDGADGAADAPARALMWSAAVSDLLFVAALLVMVTQP